MNDIVARILLFLAYASVMVGTMGWLEPHGAAPCPSSPHDGPGGHHVGHGCMQRLAVEPRSPAMLAPVSNSPGLGTIGGDHRKEG